MWTLKHLARKITGENVEASGKISWLVITHLLKIFHEIRSKWVILRLGESKKLPLQNAPQTGFLECIEI